MLARPCPKWIAAALLATAPLLSADPPVHTNGVSPLQQFLNDNGYLTMWVENTGHNQELVRVQINGVGGDLALDTGCGRTCITSEFAQNLKLDVQKSAPATGVGGKLASGGLARVESFTINNQAINHLPTVAILPPHSAVPRNGLLGYDTMRLNSVILPVGMGYFLYKPDASPPPNFDSYLKALGYQPVPLTFGEGGLRATGSLNGHPLVAVVDCGAIFSLFDAGFVKTTVGALVTKSRMVSWGVDGRPMYVEIFVADKLTFGALTFPPTRTTTAPGTTLSAIHAQALLGYDLLAEHRAIIDLGHNVLWMK